MAIKVSPWTIKIPQTLLNDPENRAYFQYLNEFLRGLYTRTGGPSDIISTASDEIVSLRTLSGTATSANDLDTFTGTIIPNDSTIKNAIQALETNLDTANSNISTQTTRVNSLVTLSGVANNSTSLGTFTGTIISDNSTIKTALQELESYSATTSGTVTSVAALTLGTTGTDLSSSVATATSTPVITLNVPSASAVNRGALAAADFVIFNSKQAALVSGTNLKTVNGSSLLGSGDLGIITGIYGGTGVNNGASTITLAGNLVTSGANSLTLTTTGATNVTLPTSGTLVNSAVTTLSSLVSIGTITTGVWNGSTISNSYLTNSSLTVNGTSIALGASGTVTAAAGTLTGGTLNSSVTASSLTSVGTITTGVWNGTALVTTSGGTGLTSYTAGDLTYFASGTALTKLAIGANNYVLTSSGSAPQWTANTGTGSVARASLPSFTTTIGVGGATASASGSGISFPASQSASTDPNTLDDYEEGTWTPVDSSGAGLGLTVSAAKYTKIGNIVTLSATINYPATASGAAVLIGGIPFTVAGSTAGTSRPWTDAGVDFTLFVYSSFGVFMRTNANVDITNAQMSGKFIYFSLQYQAA
jgi:hypothetical protein